MPIPAINAPQILHLSIPATADRPSVKIGAICDQHRGVYVTASLTLEHPVTAITATLLAKMRLGGLRRDALRAALAERNPELAQRPALRTFFKGGFGRPVSEKARLTPSQEQLENAALIYRLARLAGEYPVQAVSRSFGLEPEDARHWVWHARKTGEL